MSDSYPINSLSKKVKCLKFKTILLRLKIIDPGSCFGQAHQDRFNAAIGLQSELGSLVVNEVEFYISAAPQIAPLQIRVIKT